MNRAKSYVKHIACLESFWNDDIEHRLSVVPILELLTKMNGTRFVALSSNTYFEFLFNLELIQHKRGFKILYLAFHGYRGGIYLPDTKIDIEDLSEVMKKSFRNWIIFFNSCQALKVEKSRIYDFISKTGVMMVMGYKEKLNWIDGAALDLLLLDWLQYYKDMASFWDRFRRLYKDLVRITGLEVYHQ
jgi:hypothetical protein